MAGKIPQPFIDQVLNQTDIVDLIGGFIELKKKGKEYQACCPFHHEKTPSFTVSPDKQFYHCFGCGAHGTVVGFLMEYDGLQFVEAIESLANRLGLEVPKDTSGNHYKNDNDNLYRALEQASEYYRSQLRSDKQAIEYLKSRNLSGETAAKFDIGYSPEGYENIKKRLQEKFGEDTLLQVGLLSKKDQGKSYDKFRNRIMFPIKDTRGRVIGFGARITDKGEPKYLNSPETPLFHKGRTLYGLYEARKAPGRISQLIIVEGYMDVVALAQHGINNSVATLGTATTSEHIKMLLRYSADLVFCFDGDRAGLDAAWHALEQLLPQYTDGIDVKFAFMPSGEDPDSVVRQYGKEKFDEFIQDAAPLSAFFFNKLSKEVDLSTLEGRDKLANTAKPLLQKLPKGVFRDLMAKELNTRVGTKVASPNSLASTPPVKQLHTVGRGSPKYTKTRLAVALLLRDTDLAMHALSVEELHYLVKVPGVNLLIEMLNILEEHPGLQPISLLERFRERDEYIHLQKLLDWDPPDVSNREQSFIDVMQRFASDVQRAKLGALVENSLESDN